MRTAPKTSTLLRKFLALVFATATALSVQAESPGETETEPESEPTETERTLPFFREWFEDKGVDLPLPFGVGMMGIFMERDIEVTDVTVQFLGRPPQSISDRAEFAVSNTTLFGAARFDAWILPFVNVYAMVGKAQTDSSLRTIINIKPPIGAPIEVEVEENSKVDGPMYGVGATAVVGGDAWFAMLDANYTIADLDLFDEEIRAWLYSGRIGWHGYSKHGQVRVWGGMIYMDSERTLTITEELPVVGVTEIAVSQRPVDPLTYQIGASLTLNERWDLMAEVGSNFDDALIGVFSATWRF